MSTAFKKTFEARRIKGMELKNRLIMAPLGTRFPVDDGIVSQQMIDYYAARARGGTAIIIVEATYPASYRVSKRPCINDDKFIPGLRKLANAIRAEGAKAAIQINPHLGRRDKIYAISASGLANPVTGEESRALNIDEIKKLVEDTGEGVRRVVEAGFDSVMLHGAHGYLVQDFMSPLTNKRTDEYGGSLENRARFVVELTEITRRKAGPDYPVLIRIPGDERLPGGNGLTETIAIAKMLKEAGVDAIDVSSGALESDEWVSADMYMPAAANVPLAQAIKEGVKLPVSVPGKIKDPYLIEQILAEGKADFIVLGRPLLADPEFARKMMEGRIEDIRTCISCVKCNEAIGREDLITCSVNPAVGREKEFELRPAERKKRVLVVGGGPAGMESAIIAKQRGHDVTLWEESDKLGGQLHLAIKPPHKGEISGFLEYLIRQMEKLNIKVELAKEATPESVLRLAPDAVILATGAKPLIPNIPGMKKRDTVYYSDVLSGEKKIKGKAIVVGGGYIGCETALFLAEEGNDIAIIEILDKLAADVFHRIRKHLLDNLAEKRVMVFAGVKEEELVQNGVRIKDKDGQEILLEADAVVIACGSTPDQDLVSSLQGKVAELYEVGDCVKPRNIIEATQEGATAALKI